MATSHPSYPSEDDVSHQRAELVDRLEAWMSVRGFSEEVLDDLVHDAKSEEASAINNDGRRAQLTYLIEGFTLTTPAAVAEALADLQRLITEAGEDRD